MFSKVFAAAFFLFFGALHIFAQDEITPVKWSLNVEKPMPNLSKGDIFDAVLRAKIDAGWHLYALDKIEGGPFPTRISVVENSPFELGKIGAPPPIESEDSAFGATTKFYENAVEFGLPLKVAEDFDKNSTKLKIKVRFQVCNDEMCLPPSNLIVESGTPQQSEKR